ncbi:prolyl 3-hydroxylase 3-like [Branchiostoma lanceolatum]|uniref:procollagen-proline 3-dioxygenase n=1 Tax=Branchiostoma lanceolatum TaxID=7740 RepID=A0A8K0A4J2_BRALA|nr:P3H2 [Branchiostoma lanceolatum]
MDVMNVFLLFLLVPLRVRLVSANAKAAATPKLPVYGYDMVDVTLTANPGDLKGEKRVLVDGLATQGECDMMLDLAQVGAKPDIEGSHWYSEYEIFEGLEVLQAAQLAQQGAVPIDSAEKLLTLSDKARRFVLGYFGLPELYLTYTHLVCRTADANSTDDRTDLSHPVHADNCQLDLSDFSCPQVHPLYTPRHYSAVLFLNDGFKGGEFFFAHNKNFSAQSRVKPKCGRLVGFSSGEENLHGVQAVLSGRRCVIAMWYTMDRRYREESRQEARKLLQSLQKPLETKSEL